MAMLQREVPRIKSEYVYRRTLQPTELLPALGVGLGVGALAFYITYLFLQRTPLVPEGPPAVAPAKRLAPGAAD